METHKCSFDEEKLIGSAYGDVGFINRLRVFFHIKKCRTCAELYKEYKRTALTFASLRPEKCPPSVTDRVEERIGFKQKTGKGFIDPVLDFVFYRPSYALSGTAVIVMLAVFLTIQFTDVYAPAPDVHYSDAEIRQAQEDIEKTFAMIVPVVHNAEVHVRDKVIRSQVLPPVQHSVEKTNQLFKKGLQ